jgi:cytochrome P450
VCGTPVPAGSMVAVLPYLIHRNPAVWPNPARFDPARFLSLAGVAQVTAGASWPAAMSWETRRPV